MCIIVFNDCRRLYCASSLGFLNISPSHWEHACLIALTPKTGGICCQIHRCLFSVGLWSGICIIIFFVIISIVIIIPWHFFRWWLTYKFFCIILNMRGWVCHVFLFLTPAVTGTLLTLTISAIPSGGKLKGWATLLAPKSIRFNPVSRRKNTMKVSRQMAPLKWLGSKLPMTIPVVQQDLIS